MENRNVHRPTDILSFPFHEPCSPGILPNLREISSDGRIVEEMKNFGDLYLCLPYIQNMCQQYNFSIEERLPTLLVHGVCHLMGYDHETDADYQVMSRVEDKLLLSYWSWRNELAKSQNMIHLEPIDSSA
ncbi:hypothetical protein DSO57_1016750 [Entomophthora muscae]|uniref:Uncharacterized protein n=1 Tax=Entomophthora muscae TaxID=34485 RepID=A0ACC2TSG3_9FUNG|nr:hypothetical protein DSO57_1016750 [Entomophthora muscae]